MHAPAQPKPCRRIQLTGEVSAGQVWQAPIGQGWTFRILPVQPAQAGSGWDLVVDREPPTGYPDALLLATPPYNSVNEREIASTFGLRSQDALGWNVRSFRFLTDPAAFHDAQSYFLQLARSGGLARPNAADTSRLLNLVKHASSGQLRILDARLTPGTADGQPFAENWARAFSRSSYTIQDPPQGHATALGSINWIRFTVTLDLPATWRFPPGVQSAPSACAQ